MKRFILAVLVLAVVGCGTSPVSSKNEAGTVVLNVNAYLKTGETINIYQNDNIIFSYDGYCSSCSAGYGSWQTFSFRCNPTDTLTAIKSGRQYTKIPSDPALWTIQ